LYDYIIYIYIIILSKLTYKIQAESYNVSILLLTVYFSRVTHSEVENVYTSRGHTNVLFRCRQKCPNKSDRI